MRKDIKLRFAPLVRVSTERQERQGESLQVQIKRIKECVEKLGGVIPDYCWDKYCGQEHATTDQERKKFEMLLSDASKDLFDAVIVHDATRWSRDNKKNKEGLEILRDNDIHFYILSNEIDLYSPEQCLFIGMSAEIGEFQARMQVFKSTLSKIERAKQGKASSGKIPYGRIFEKGQWSIDLDKKARVKVAIDRYLDGGSLDEISKIMGVCRSQVHYIFSKRLGTDYEINFDVGRLKINETVKMTIPALVDEDTIKRVHERLQTNKTCTRNGFIKNRYLLNRLILCEQCGYALTGTSYHGKLYYKHTRRGCTGFGSIPAELIEDEVLSELIDTVGDQIKMREAAQRAMPDLQKKRELLNGIEAMEKELDDFDKQKGRLIDSIAKDIISEEDAVKKIANIREGQAAVQTNIDRYRAEVGTMLTEEQLQSSIQLRLRQLQGIYRTDTHLNEMTFDDKKRMLQDILNGKDANGKRRGVYIKKMASKRKLWLYRVRGALGDTLLNGRLSDKLNLADKDNPGNCEDSGYHRP